MCLNLFKFTRSEKHKRNIYTFPDHVTDKDAVTKETQCTTPAVFEVPGFCKPIVLLMLGFMFDFTTCQNDSVLNSTANDNNKSGNVR